MKTLQTLLIANRGEISLRIGRAARGLGLRTVALLTPQDRGALHGRGADRAAMVPSYLDVDAILDAAARTGADAVHPGYGFLAENAGFASAVLRAGLTWVGPPPSAIEAMGAKVEARRRMSAQGVPVVPGSDPAARSEEDLLAEADRVGYPVLVKASAGGGGKGMKVVHSPDGLRAALEEARRLALVAFGDDHLFLERYLARARHVEVQILADQHGAVTHLWERECSVQRRHQKVIEEAPSPAFVGLRGEERRRLLCEDAVRAAAAVGYVGAGTVELLVQGEEHYFLEMNTRIQVEHPVTEMITGVDLVTWQLRVAMGEALDPALLHGGAPRRGWAVEARLYAEDPEQGYLPGAGRLARWCPPAAVDGPGGALRIDAGVEQGSEVGIHYDPMLAKLIAWGPSRDTARRRLAAALESTIALGLPTNRAQLQAVLEHPAFAEGALHTRFLDEHADALRPVPEPARDEAALIAVLFHELRRRAASSLPAVPPGWRSNRWRPSRLRLALGDREVELRWVAEDAAPDRLTVNDAPARVEVEGDRYWIERGGLFAPFSVVADGDLRWVWSRSADLRVRVLPEFPEPDPLAATGAGALFAPMPGRVVAVQVAVGEAVVQGQPLVVLEAMKMEQVMRAAMDGVVRQVPVRAGQQVDTGDLLVAVEGEG